MARRLKQNVDHCLIAYAGLQCMFAMLIISTQI